MRPWPLEHEDSTHTPYSVTHLLVDISLHISSFYTSIYPVILRDLEPGPGCLPPLISKKEAVQKQHVFANKTDIRKRRLGVQICGVDKKVTINVAAEQPTIIGF